MGEKTTKTAKHKQQTKTKITKQKHEKKKSIIHNQKKTKGTQKRPKTTNRGKD